MNAVPCRAGAALALAALVGGCAPASFLAYRPELPLTIHTPAVRAGVQDQRATFGALFEAERAAAGDARPGPWLHNAPSGARIPAGLEARFRARAAGTVVLVVTGLFGDCTGAQSVPFGDGKVRAPERNLVDSYAQYDDLGLRAIRLVATPGRAASAANGVLIAGAIRTAAGEPEVERVIVVAYSKGLPDTLHALARLRDDGGVPAALVAVVSVAGAVMGTPLADYVEGVYERLSPRVTPLDCTPSQGGDVSSLTRRERIRWLAQEPPPPGPAYYSVVNHVPLAEMAPPLRVTGGELALIDPRNDGQLIAADMLLPASVLLAEARADHWDVALPRDRHPSAAVRSLTSQRGFPREALFRALVKWAVAGPDAR